MTDTVDIVRFFLFASDPYSTSSPLSITSPDIRVLFNNLHLTVLDEPMQWRKKRNCAITTGDTKLTRRYELTESVSHLITRVYLFITWSNKVVQRGRQIKVMLEFACGLKTHLPTLHPDTHYSIQSQQKRGSRWLSGFFLPKLELYGQFARRMLMNMFAVNECVRLTTVSGFT